MDEINKTLTSELEEKLKLEEIERNSKMSIRRKAIKQMYSDTTGVRTFVRKSTSSAASIFTSSNLTTILNSAGSSSFNWDRAKQLTDYAYGTNSNYATIVDFLSNMYLWRYFYMPVKAKKEVSADYTEIYDLMTSVVDGLNIEVIFPIILTNLYKDGIVYLYTSKDTSSQTVITFLLDPAYCQPIMMSQYGTGIYQFDATYFDNLGLNVDTRDEVLKLYPKELTQAYSDYQTDRNQRYHIIDGRYGTFLRLNDLNFPTKLSVIKSIFDYDTYRANEVERNSAQLDKIISHKIPSYEDQLLFEVEEVHDLHTSMKAQLASNSRTRLLTTFGDLEVHHLGENDKIQNEILEKAHNAIYSAGGLNTNIFNGDSDKSLAMSLAKDAATTWKFIEQLVSFYNLTLNNLYNFKGYQVELTMLPITHYNKAESLELYRSNAEYGVGILEFIVASGTKQKHITPKAELETYLKLEEILQPLQSSHTQSGKDTSTDSAPGTTEPTADKPKEETKTPAVNDKAK